MRRSAVSIPSNIAEGAGRDGGAFKQFLEYAAGSASELETQLDIARELGFGAEPAVSRALGEVDIVRRMLWGLISSRRDQ
jgi:four helix bundle protein